MNKTLAALLAAATITITLAAGTTDASARWRGRGWGFGPASRPASLGRHRRRRARGHRPPGYVVYPAYGQPVYEPACYWASQPIYDRWGRVVGYSGRPVQVCPGY